MTEDEIIAWDRANPTPADIDEIVTALGFTSADEPWGNDTMTIHDLVMMLAEYGLKVVKA